MNIRATLKKQITDACQKARVYGTAYVGTQSQLKKPVREQIDKTYGKDFIMNADYIVFYVVKQKLDQAELAKRIVAGNNSLGVKPEYKETDVHPIEFDNQNENISYAFTLISREQLESYQYVKDASVDNIGDPDGIHAGEDHPLEAITYAEENNIGPNETIINAFTPALKEKLSKMIKHGEFSQQEGAIITWLMTGEGKFEDLAVMLGAKSKRTKGEPMSKIAARKELNRIFDVIAKRTGARTGKKIDLSKIAEYRRVMKKEEAEKKKKARENKKKERAARAEFWKVLKELNQEQRKHGLKVSRYDKIWTQNTQSLDAMRAAYGDHFEEA